MADNSDVVDRVDSLMRRRRSFVAAPANTPEPASLPLPQADDDDLPVLTEVVPAQTVVSEERSEPFDETQVELLAADLARAIGQQLACDLPLLLEAALRNAAEELRAGIGAAMETALSDFIARRKQLQLPLDEPERND
jgi:hypothetical protein